MASRDSYPPIDDIRYVITKKTHIIVMPAPVDFAHTNAREESQALANSSGQRVRLMFRDSAVEYFDPHNR